MGGRFHVDWAYSKNVHRRETIERVAQSFLDNLRSLLADCRWPKRGGFALGGLSLPGWDDDVADAYSLSDMQQLMLVHAVSAPESGVLQEQLRATLRGELDVAALRRAWQRVIDRHPALRTAFLWEGVQKPLQVVRRRVDVPWEFQDWRGDEAGGEPEAYTPRANLAGQQGRITRERLKACLEADRSRGFLLTRAPLMRLTLIQTAADIFHFFWSSHHLLFDGWSLAIILQEVFEFYEAFAQGRPWDPAPPPGYRDYIEWLERQDLSAAEAFWRRTLEGFRTTLMPARARRDAGPTNRQGRHTEERLRLSAETTSGLRSFAERHGVTLNTLVTGAWALVVSFLNGQDDVVLGTTVSGRPACLPGAASIVGPFINILPVRVRVDPHDLVLPWLANLQAWLAQLRQYEHTPLARIVQWANVPSGERLFESLLVFENYPVDAALRGRPGNLEISDLGAPVRTSFPLTLAAVPGPELSLAISYEDQRFDAVTIRRMLGELRRLLELVRADPLRRMGDLGGRSTWSQDRADLCQHERAAAAVAGRPQAPPRTLVAPRDRLETRLAAVWSDLLGVEPIGVTENFFHLGGDSTLAVRLMGRIEAEYGRKLPLAALFQDASIEHLAGLLRSPETADAEQALVAIQPKGTRRPLFCVHPAGGTVFCYLDLARRLGPDQPVSGLQAQGVDGRQPPLAQIDVMAAQYVAAIRMVQPSGPYLLLGWSLGGIVAFEMARQLEGQGHRVPLLAVVDAGMKPPAERFLEADFLPILLEMFPRESRPDADELRRLAPAEQLEFFRQRAEEAHLVAGGDSPIQYEHVWRVFQANLHALVDYRPQRYCGKLTLLRASEHATAIDADPQMGWGHWAAGGVEVHVIHAQHVHMLREPDAAVLAERLQACLDAAARWGRTAAAME